MLCLRKCLKSQNAKIVLHQNHLKNKLWFHTVFLNEKNKKVLILTYFVTICFLLNCLNEEWKNTFELEVKISVFDTWKLNSAVCTKSFILFYFFRQNDLTRLAAFCPIVIFDNIAVHQIKHFDYFIILFCHLSYLQKRDKNGLFFSWFLTEKWFLTSRVPPASNSRTPGWELLS
jgi:hypothetical protein